MEMINREEIACRHLQRGGGRTVILAPDKREVLVLEFTSVAPMTLMGLAALILALGAGDYLIKRAGPLPERIHPRSQTRDTVSEPPSQELLIPSRWATGLH